ncbi:MAG: hypothetical protein A2096_16780 [Spirochaetes bacterium GWF1_41_5]|nr:MAG: hypothetical protein A2096_16780 [Spirochaetes bacterium GWF1_41_5]HBE03824.1 hypothetical protein [Spirochaetia bacterium]
MKLIHAAEFLAGARPLFILVPLVWFLTQTIKLVMILILERRLDFSTYLATGSMPSSHSALVSTLTAGLFIIYGYDSPFFILSLFFSIITMHDAVKVRGAVGNNTKAMKNFLSDIIDREYDKKKLIIKALIHKVKKSSKEKRKKKRELSRIYKMQKELKDLRQLEVVLGHTLLEVIVGALFGIICAVLFFKFIKR